jgi:galactonate dehydratase
MMFRRELLFSLLPSGLLKALSRPPLKVSGMDVSIVKVNERGNWVFVTLKTDKALAGLGEASQGSSDEQMRESLAACFEFVRGESPFDVESFHRRAWQFARAGGRRTATAFSAIEHAMWDLAGKALGIPVYDMLGGKLRDELEVYANINRATNGERTPDAFARNALRAVEEGFRAIKAAPFDGFPKLSSPRQEIEKATGLGIACLEAIRRAVGPGVKVLVDCHSQFNRELAIEVARRLEAVDLYWYEEPVPVMNLADAFEVGKSIRQPLSGGEMLFGAEGFAPLLQSKAFAFSMPDVKHCGGILEAKRTAALAQLHDVAVSPHNPSGPVATAASVQVCAGIPNFAILEHAWGEAVWSRDLVIPPEQFQDGKIRVPLGPGLGIEIDKKTLAAHAI